MRTERLFIDDIDKPKGHRDLDDATVRAITDSMRAVGQLQPITVKDTGNSYQLVSGAHRIAAVKAISEAIPHIDAAKTDPEKGVVEAIVLPYDWDGSIRMVEIAENLHRAELSKLERAALTNEWIKLTGKKEAGVSAQVGPKLSSRGRKDEGRPESGTKGAARKAGVERHRAQRAETIEKLPPEVKIAAKELGLDDNQTALLKAAKAPDPLASLREHKATKEAKKAERKTTKKQKPSAAVLEAEDEAFADWLLEHAEPREVAQIVSWLEMKRNKQVVEIIRRRNNQND